MKNKLFVTLGILGMSMLAYARPQALSGNFLSKLQRIDYGGVSGMVPWPRRMVQTRDYGHYGAANKFDETIVPSMYGPM